MMGSDKSGPQAADATDVVSLVVTSCGRFDLLDRTLASFFHHNTYPIGQCIIVEDSTSDKVRDVVRQFPAHFEVIVNKSRKGQIASIDLAYARVTSPFIFHCEDDWVFLGPRFIEDSIVILKGCPQVSVVNMTCPGVLDEMDATIEQCPTLERSGVRFKIIPPQAHELWFGYSFNPGLRRTTCYRRLGSFSAVGHEPEVSLYFKRLGMSMAHLEQPGCIHIGGTRHVDDKVFPITRSRAFQRYWQKGSKRRLSDKALPIGMGRDR
jgi:hypothetical protein